MRSSRASFALAFAFAALSNAHLACAQPKEIDHCQTIDEPGSYVLANPIGPPPPGMLSCLEIAADFVTVDLAGFPIIGSNHSNGISIHGRGSVVRNGTVANFATGIRIVGEIAMVEGVRAVGNFVGIGTGPLFESKAIGYVKDNIALENSDDGISLGFGIASGNNAVNNKGRGIRAGFITLEGDSGSGNVTNNVAVSNNGIGIEVFCPFNVIDNMGIENRAFGVLPLVGIRIQEEDAPAPCNASGNLSR
jgi:hypothetical protein